MDLISIILKILPYTLIAVIIGLILIGGILFGYKLYKKRGGKQSFSKKQFMVFFLTICWFFLVIGITMLNRGANFEGWFNFRLFSGYISAWNNWSLSEIQLIIFNMLMFVPLGFLLPLLLNEFKKIKTLFITSFLVTILIETLQLVTKRGVFELDDIFHNTMGSLLGYFIITSIIMYLEKHKITFKIVMRAIAIPFVFSFIFLVAIFIYNIKEFGNLTIVPSILQVTSKGSINLNIELSKEQNVLSIYKSDNINNIKYGEEILSIIKDQFMLKQIGNRRIDGYNRVYHLIDDSKISYYYNYSLNDGGWFLSKETITDEIPKEETLNKQRKIIEKWLINKDLIPANTIFSIQNENTLRWDIDKPIDIKKNTNEFPSGIIMIQVSDYSLIPESIFYTMNNNDYIRKVNTISPYDAFKEVKRGNFNQYNDLPDNFILDINNYEIEYIYDTKGYYLPAYRFEGKLNGEEWNCLVPAI